MGYSGPCSLNNQAHYDWGKQHGTGAKCRGYHVRQSWSQRIIMVNIITIARRLGGGRDNVIVIISSWSTSSSTSSWSPVGGARGASFSPSCSASAALLLLLLVLVFVLVLFLSFPIGLVVVVAAAAAAAVVAVLAPI